MALLIYRIIFALLFCAACSSGSKPDFVTDIGESTSHPNLEEAICFSIDPAVLWEQGNDGKQLNDHILASTGISVDGAKIDDIEIFISDIARVLRDDNGNVLGIVGGNITYCFRTVDLKTGQHTGVIETSSLSGETYSYTWTFEFTIDRRYFDGQK